jgi:hypothetical protein
MSLGSPAKRAVSVATIVISAGSATPTHPRVQVAPSIRERNTRCAHTASRVACPQRRHSNRSRSSFSGTGRGGRPGNKRPSTETGSGPVTSHINADRAVSNGSNSRSSKRRGKSERVTMSGSLWRSSGQRRRKEATPATTEMLRNHYRITTNRLPHYYGNSWPIITGDYEDLCRLCPVDHAMAGQDPMTRGRSTPRTARIPTP